VPGSGESLDKFRERLRNTPLHLCRLRHCGQGEWSLAFHKRGEEYEPSFFQNGTFSGRPRRGSTCAPSTIKSERAAPPLVSG
jgi:hypothetical protein